LLLDERSKAAQAIKPYARREDGGEVGLPTSWAQQRLWFIDQLEGDIAAYHIAVGVRLKGNLDRDALRRALDAIVLRHEALRTVFVSADDGPQQKIAAGGRFPLRSIDVSALDGAAREARIRREKIEELHEKFDLRTGPLIRGRLLKLGDEEYVLLVTMHHIVSDGWSMGVFFRELGELYRADREGRDNPLEPLAIQYADYAQWQRQWLQGDVLNQQLGYWRQRLEGAAPELELPADRARPAVQSYRGGNVGVTLDAALTAELRALAQRHEMTLFMVLYAAWALLLARLSGQDDIVIGTPVANRQREELEGLIGFFVNTLVLRVEARGEIPVAQFLARVKEVTLGAYEHQDVPFEQVVEMLQPERSLGRNPLFQVMFALQSVPTGELKLSRLTALTEEGLDVPAMFDLLLSLEERGNEIAGSVSYASDLFDRGTVERWMACFAVLLKELTDAGEVRIGELPILPEFERRQVLDVFNATRAAYPQDKLLHELFEAQVARAPEAVALECEGRSLAYAELNARANQLARYLSAKGVRPDQPVGLCLERSLELVIGMLGIWKAGGAYVPLDPDYPSGRLAAVLEDAAPKVVLIQERVRERLPATTARVIALDAEWSEIAGSDSSNLDPRDLGLRSDHLAYVIYTSGSTGEPKGVMVEHRQVASLWKSLEHVYRRSAPCERIGVNASFTFDASVKQFIQLLSGRTLVLVPQAVRWEVPALLRLIEEQRIDGIDCTPAQLRGWIDAGLLKDRAHRLRMVLVGGEPIDAELWSTLAESTAIDFYNVYGPTESTVDTTAACVNGDASTPHIGRPMENRQVYLLDRQGQPVPIGVSGELYIGGAGVARGYLNRPEVTAERFIKDPFSTDSQARLYKSGDLGRWRADGTLEYLGRNDSQVKIRGFRIELGEIEAQLVRHPTVREAVVLAREDIPGEKRLVAYLVPNGAHAPSAEALRAHAKETLPEYMVPSAFVVLERLPLTPNGKLDRRALPAPELDAYVTRQYEPPQGEVEEILAGIWQELLKVERVGRYDNFFELGGHSLLATRVISQLEHVLDVDVPIRVMFEQPTIEALGRCIEREWVAEASLEEVL
jgi:amino acid adenylation domain-containing protein